MNYKRVLAVAKAGVIEAGESIRGFSRINLKSSFKPSGSTEASQIVTEADLKSQEIILKHLKPIMDEFNLGLLAEERDNDSSRFEKEYFLAIDPLDGTLPFSKGDPGYSISVSLITNSGIPVMGVVYDPYRENLYTSIVGEGVYKNGKKFIPVEKKDSLSWVYDSSFKQSTHFEKLSDLVSDYANKNSIELEVIDYGGAVFNAIYIMENNPGIYFKPPKKREGGGAIWDFAATNLFFNELNSTYISSDSLGKGLSFNRKSIFFNDTGVIYSSCPELLKAIKEIEFD